jgi:polyhydroxyalkanoate synthesis regulator phasin
MAKKAKQGVVPMTHRILAAATLMLVTTASAWAETEGVPNVKTPEPEKVETQMEETLDDIQNYSVEQKNEAMRVARHAIDDLNQQITLLQGDINSQWRDLSQDARLHKQEALASLKEQQTQLETRYQALQNASEDNWDVAKVKFQQSWEAAKQGWQSLTAPAPAQE